MSRNEETWNVRNSLFEFFVNCGAQLLRDNVRQSDEHHPYIQVLRATDRVEVALWVSDLRREMWLYVVSLDPTGELDRVILGGVNRNSPTGAVFVDCSNEHRHGNDTRNVFKLVRSIDWENITQADYCLLLDDYNWLTDELQRIGVL